MTNRKNISPGFERYHDYIRAWDSDYRAWESRLTADAYTRRVARMREVNKLAATLPSGERNPRRAARFRAELAESLKICMAGVPDSNFEFQPDTRYWLKLAADEPRNQALLRETISRVTRALGRGYKVPADVYGNLKAPRSVSAKVAAVRVAGEPLDLWDLCRLRIVPETLHGVSAIAAILKQECEREVLRIRNYYTNPRSSNSLYRAVHLILSGGGGFVEIQIMTVSREVVCQLDHAVAFKRSLAPLDGEHTSWLERMSLAANLHDLTNGFLGRRSAA
jgi:hypothetical protein